MKPNRNGSIILAGRTLEQAEEDLQWKINTLLPSFETGANQCNDMATMTLDGRERSKPNDPADNKQNTLRFAKSRRIPTERL
jgi:hypothetical protein